MDLADSVLALQSACDQTHSFRFREEWVFAFLGIRAMPVICLLAGNRPEARK